MNNHNEQNICILNVHLDFWKEEPSECGRKFMSERTKTKSYCGA
jgi:hypothetical protein